MWLGSTATLPGWVLLALLQLCLLPFAASAAVPLAPAAVGVHSTVPAAAAPAPRLVPVQASDVIENAAEPENVIVKAPGALPPELVSVNVWLGVSPTLTAPKSNVPGLVVGDQAITGGPPASPAAGASSTTADAT